MPVRCARSDDAPAIARVQTETWRIAYRGIMPDSVLDRLSEEELAARWRVRLSDSQHGTLVAERDGRLVGFADAGPSRDDDASTATGELFALYVAADSWGIGVGRDLWEAARSALATNGFHEATLWVLEANVRARAFYERTGFVFEPGATKVTTRDGVNLIQIRYRTRWA